MIEDCKSSGVLHGLLQMAEQSGPVISEVLVKADHRRDVAEQVALCDMEPLELSA